MHPRHPPTVAQAVSFELTLALHVASIPFFDTLELKLR